MTQDAQTKPLLANRPQICKYVLLLMAAQCIGLLSLALFLPTVLNGWTNVGVALLLALVSYYFASTNSFSDREVSTVQAVSLVGIASLIANSSAASPMIFSSHYAQILALGVIGFYRNRRLMAIATGVAVLEQVLRSVYLPDTIFAETPVRHELLIEHICWLAGSGVILMMFCDAAPPLLAQNADSSVPATAAPQAPLPAVAAEPGSLSELIKLATDVGARSQKLSRSITNLEGPLKRMVQSINGANRGMQEIKDELSRTTASVIQITKGSEMHANQANHVFKAADEAAYGSQIGAQSTELSIHNMDRIREQMDSIAQSMDNLLSKSQKMVQVVGFASELALQSKVLSVNAAIEAAKAGDRGQGFSAVATEVKSLAVQSKEATREVRQILKEIQFSIADVRRSIAQGNETVDLASEQCRSTADSIKGLDSSVSSSRAAAESIMVSSKEQVQGIMQLSRVMNDISTVSEQNSGSLGNLQVEAQKLNNIAKELVSDMKSYQGLIDDLVARCANVKQD